MEAGRRGANGVLAVQEKYAIYPKRGRYSCSTISYHYSADTFVDN